MKIPNLTDHLGIMVDYFSKKWHQLSIYFKFTYIATPVIRKWIPFLHPWSEMSL